MKGKSLDFMKRSMLFRVTNSSHPSENNPIYRKEHIQKIEDTELQRLVNPQFNKQVV